MFLTDFQFRSFKRSNQNFLLSPKDFEHSIANDIGVQTLRQNL